MLDALAGKDYDNPYTEEGLEASYENYDLAFEAYYDQADTRRDWHREVDNMGMEP
jgi:hypothetical protein